MFKLNDKTRHALMGATAVILLLMIARDAGELIRIVRDLLTEDVPEVTV